MVSEAPTFESRQEAIDFVASHTYINGLETPLSELYPQVRSYMAMMENSEA